MWGRAQESTSNVVHTNFTFRQKMILSLRAKVTCATWFSAHDVCAWGYGVVGLNYSTDGGEIAAV